MKGDETKEGRMGEEKDEKQQMLGWFLFKFELYLNQVDLEFPMVGHHSKQWCPPHWEILIFSKDLNIYFTALPAE